MTPYHKGPLTFNVSFYRVKGIGESLYESPVTVTDPTGKDFLCKKDFPLLTEVSPISERGERTILR